jgi:hypothetical protein
MARLFSRSTGPRVGNARAEAPLRRGRRWSTWSLGAACATLLGAGIAVVAAQADGPLPGRASREALGAWPRGDGTS